MIERQRQRTSSPAMVILLIVVVMAGINLVAEWVNRPRELSPPEVLTDAMHNWPQWRGPLATGVAPHADPPIEWSETKNIRWKVELPGKGHSTPIVWGDRVFVTAGGVSWG